MYYIVPEVLYGKKKNFYSLKKQNFATWQNAKSYHIKLPYLCGTFTSPVCGPLKEKGRGDLQTSTWFNKSEYLYIKWELVKCLDVVKNSLCIRVKLGPFNGGQTHQSISCKPISKDIFCCFYKSLERHFIYTHPFIGFYLKII